MRLLSNMDRSQSAPGTSRRSTSRQSSSMSMRNSLIEEPDLWEHYMDEDRPEEPKWNLLLTNRLKKLIKYALVPSERKKHSNKAADLTLNHWLHMKKLQFDALHNKLGIREHNVVELDTDLMNVSPTFEEYASALVTICKMKSGGVWDMEQKSEILVNVYGRSKRGHLNRDEFAEVLQKHAKVKVRAFHFIIR